MIPGCGNDLGNLGAPGHAKISVNAEVSVIMAMSCDDSCHAGVPKRQAHHYFGRKPAQAAPAPPLVRPVQAAWNGKAGSGHLEWQGRFRPPGMA
jgi:hypothetical protein